MSFIKSFKKLPSSSRPEPTARIAVCGGFIMPENSLIPNIPKFEILHNKIAYVHTHSRVYTYFMIIKAYVNVPP